jgi:hypothetical protein
VLLYDCPKFAGCNAPVCPMYEHWRETAHFTGERVCLWLRELQKPGGTELVAGTLRGDMFEAVSKASTEIMARSVPGYANLRRVLRRAASSGSKVASGERLRARP